jgi:hypothetical protein
MADFAVFRAQGKFLDRPAEKATGETALSGLMAHPVQSMSRLPITIRRQHRNLAEELKELSARHDGTASEWKRYCSRKRNGSDTDIPERVSTRRHCGGLLT